MAVVDLRSLKDLQRVLRLLERRISEGVTDAAAEAADWGVGKATSATMKSGATATQTVALSWISRRVDDGAIVANSAEHYIYVEVGRKPGRAPPLDALEEWARTKKLIRAKSERRKAKRRRIKISFKDRWRFLFAVQAKIARRGTKGRFILRDLAPLLGNRYFRQIKIELGKITLSPPR